MSCSIIGQSNSILRTGFATKLFSRTDVQLSMAGRMGGSSSLICPLFANDEFMKSSSFCIIDCCVVDYSIIRDETSGYFDIIEWIDWVGHQARLNGCIPIFVIIPIEYFIRRDEAFFRIYLELIKRSGHFYLDFRDIAKIYFPDPTEAPLYLDGAHPGEQLAEKAAEVIAFFLSNFDRIHLLQTTFKYLLRSFEVINLQDCLLSDNELATRENSLFVFRGVKIDGEHPGRFKTKSFGKLHGVVVNAARTRCNLSFLSGKLVKNFNLIPYGPAEYEVRAVPLLFALSNAEDTIEISVSMETDSTVEGTMRSKKDSLETSGSAEISDLIVETGMRYISYDFEVPSPVDSNILNLFMKG